MTLRLLGTVLAVAVLGLVFNAYLSPDMRLYFFQQLPFCS
jgi:hypothetical protein